MKEEILESYINSTSRPSTTFRVKSSGTTRKSTAGGIGSTAGWGICHSFTEDGRCVSLLKIMLTNHCIYDCAYSINRRSNDLRRATFSVSELVELTIEFYRRNYIEGLFLSSWYVIRLLWERMNGVVKDLRTVHRFNGWYPYEKHPGASEALVHEAGLYADRMSVNIEIPTEENLKMLAPKKKTMQAFINPCFTFNKVYSKATRKGKNTDMPTFCTGGTKHPNDNRRYQRNRQTNTVHFGCCTSARP